MFTIQVADRTFEGRKKLVIEDGKIYIDHEYIQVSTQQIIVTGDVENFESDGSVEILLGDDKTWIARSSHR
jgi:hypothetical protein